MTRRRVEIGFEFAECSAEADADYNHLADELSKPRVIEAVRRAIHSVHRLHIRADGTPLLDHLERVSAAAGFLAQAFYAEADLGECRYGICVCKTAGLLHEFMITSGWTYEELVLLTDLETAGVICALTPDNRIPAACGKDGRYARRFEILGNRIGLAGAMAQLVAVCDLALDALLYLDMARQRLPGAVDRVSLYTSKLNPLLGCLAALERHPVTMPYLARLKAVSKELEAFVRSKPEKRERARAQGRTPAKLSA